MRLGFSIALFAFVLSRGDESVILRKTVGSEGALCQVSIHVQNVDGTDGTLNVALYDSPETWLSETGITYVAGIDSSSVSVHFESLPCRHWAAAAYHDANGNGKLDRNLIGIPTEDYGFSNNPKAVFGPASWEDARFDVIEPQIQLVIRL